MEWNGMEWNGMERNGTERKRKSTEDRMNGKYEKVITKKYTNGSSALKDNMILLFRGSFYG